LACLASAARHIAGTVAGTSTLCLDSLIEVMNDE
jgi:hypothetical protein